MCRQQQQLTATTTTTNWQQQLPPPNLSLEGFLFVCLFFLSLPLFSTNRYIQVDYMSGRCRQRMMDNYVSPVATTFMINPWHFPAHLRGLCRALLWNEMVLGSEWNLSHFYFILSQQDFHFLPGFCFIPCQAYISFLPRPIFHSFPGLYFIDPKAHISLFARAIFHCDISFHSYQSPISLIA